MTRSDFQQTAQNIRTFSAGSLVCRVAPATWNNINPSLFGDDSDNNLGVVTVREIRDHSYIGEPMTYIGIANGCVYLKPVEPHPWRGGDMMCLPLANGWDEGWAEYIDPSKLAELAEKK